MSRRDLARKLGVREGALRDRENGVIPEYETVPHDVYLLLAELDTAAGRGGMSGQRRRAAFNTLRKGHSMIQKALVWAKDLGLPETATAEEIVNHIYREHAELTAFNGKSGVGDREAAYERVQRALRRPMVSAAIEFDRKVRTLMEADKNLREGDAVRRVQKADPELSQRVWDESVEDNRA